MEVEEMHMKKTMFTPVRSKRTFEDVSQQMKELIIQGMLRPGDKLPPEAELSKQFRVGRQTVREALRILELSGLISIQKGFGGGPTVRDNVVGRATEVLLDAFKMAKISFDEVTTARLAIEKAVLNEALDRADDDDIKSLKENISKAKDQVANKEIPIDTTFEFHLLLAKASKNNVFVILVEIINAINRHLRGRNPPNFRTVKYFLQKHEEILEALIRKDRDQAIHLLEKDLMAIRRPS